MTRSNTPSRFPRRFAGAALVTVAGVITALLPSAVSDAASASTGYAVSLIRAGLFPEWVAVNPKTDTIYLSSSGPYQLIVINGASGSVTATIPLASRAQGIAVDPATNTVYVAELAASTGPAGIQVISGATNTVTTTIHEPTGYIPVGIAVDSATDTVYVTNPNVANVAIINGTTNAITTTVSTGTGTEPIQVAVDESSDVAWVTDEHGSVIAISGATDSIASTLSLGSTSQPVGVAVDATTDTVYVTDVKNKDVAVIDGATDPPTLTATVATPSLQLFGVAVDSVTDMVYATSYAGPLGTTWVIDGTSNSLADTLARGGVSIAVDEATGTAYEAPYLRQNGAWVITPSASNALSPVITSLSGVTGQTGQALSFSAVANALPAATFSETGSLPSGIAFSPDGTFGGTPAAGTGGLYPITITASNGIAPDYDQAFRLTVNQPPAITSAPNATFTVGNFSNLPLQATGYPASTFSETGALPTGISVLFTSSGWQLSGTPAVGSGGVYQFTINAANGVGATVMQSFTLTVLEAPSFTSATTATFRAGTAGSFAVQAHGYPAPSFTETGKLPAGVTLSPAGMLAGKPGARAGGKYPITITAVNGNLPNATQAFTLRVDQVPAFTTARHVTFRAGKHNAFTLRTSGFPTAHLSERGRLPKGVKFRVGRNGTATLTGDPARADRGKTFVITIIATNGVGRSVRQTFRLRIT